MSSFRPSWQRLLLNRIVGKLSADYKDRIVFQTPESPAHAVHIMQMGHVLLDPFPVTGESFCARELCLFLFLGSIFYEDQYGQIFWYVYCVFVVPLLLNASIHFIVNLYR